MKDSLKFLCPNGCLGFGLTKEKSYYIGLQENPDYIACDSGSNDIGPGPLGEDICTSPKEWQMHDLELMLVEARKRNIPMLVGSAGDTGTNSRVDMFVEMIKELAKKHNLPKFKLGYFYSQVDKSILAERIKKGEVIRSLGRDKPVDMKLLDQTDNIVAVAGVHPFIKLLNEGADVIIGGRCSDCAIFAAPAIQQGFPEGNAYFLGKVLECASFCCEPYGGKESVLGTISKYDVKVKAMNPEQRCTIASVAGHAMYERSNPNYEYVAGGYLDMSQCVYEQYDERTVKVSNLKFVPQKGKVSIKLEGAGFVGERYIGAVGIRDPYSIANVDLMIDWGRKQVEEKFGKTGYQLFYHVYGKNAVMGKNEPNKDFIPNELCVMVEAIAPTAKVAEEIALTGSRQMFYARLPEVKGSAGSVAFLLDEVLRARPAYKWTMEHLIDVDDPMELFQTHTIEVG